MTSTYEYLGATTEAGAGEAVSTLVVVRIGTLAGTSRGKRADLLCPVTMLWEGTGLSGAFGVLFQDSCLFLMFFLQVSFGISQSHLFAALPPAGPPLPPACPEHSTSLL